MSNRPSTIKWLGSRAKSEFTIIPNELARDTSLSSSAFRVAVFLWSCRSGFMVSEQRLAKVLGMSPNTVSKALDNLIENRWIARRQWETDKGGSYWIYYADPAGRLTPSRIKALNGCASESDAQRASTSEALKKTNGAVPTVQPTVSAWGPPPEGTSNPLRSGEDSSGLDVTLGSGLGSQAANQWEVGELVGIEVGVGGGLGGPLPMRATGTPGKPVPPIFATKPDPTVACTHCYRVPSWDDGHDEDCPNNPWRKTKGPQ